MATDFDKWQKELQGSFKRLMACNIETIEMSEAVWDKYDALVEEVKDNKEPRFLQTLLRLFCDELDDGIQERIASAMCEMDPVLHITVLLEELPNLYQRTQFWAEDSLRYVVRLKEFPSIFRSATEEQKALIWKIASEAETPIKLPKSCEA